MMMHLKLLQRRPSQLLSSVASLRLSLGRISEQCRIRCLANDATKATTSVSADEVAKFSGMNQQWWDPSFNPLISMNPIRIKYILDIVEKEKQRFGTRNEDKNHPPLHKLKALDVGCGGGLLSESLARLGADVTAVDPSKALVDMAQQHAQQMGDPRLQRIDYRAGMTVEELAATTSEKFDLVCLLEVLEHASDVSSLLKAATSLVNPKGGLLFVSTINRTWKSYLLTIVGAEYVMGYVPPGTHTWEQYLAPDKVSGMMTRFGMQPIDIRGMVISKPPLCGNWDWRLDAKDTDCNWIAGYRFSNKEENPQ
jgi:2-polyprenyl-6-hydroxyphenyl methylase / 3-demethylubiquinone-9 3-methyltransferase